MYLIYVYVYIYLCVSANTMDNEFFSGDDVSASEDSIDVHVTPITSINKRTFRRKLNCSTRPLKKRRFESILILSLRNEQHFKPWNDFKKESRIPCSYSPQDENQQSRNYKSMSQERRIEANARERTRVHTISAAFNTLRRAIPAYSHNQKLSKLSVLRIACSYIVTLSQIINSRMNNLGDCVDHVSRTIQTEGRLRKRKDNC